MATTWRINWIDMDGPDQVHHEEGTDLLESLNKILSNGLWPRITMIHGMLGDMKPD